MPEGFESGRDRDVDMSYVHRYQRRAAHFLDDDENDLMHSLEWQVRDEYSSLILREWAHKLRAIHND